jgi:DNA-binding IclR family transcriptional regulator
MRIFEMGGLVERRHRLRSAAMPHLQELSHRFRMSAHLGVLDGHEVLYLETLPARGVSLPTRQGSRMPAYCTGLGKAMLAYSEQRIFDSVVANGLARRTEHTITTPERLRDEIDNVKATGIAYDREEAIRGIGCVAAPLRGSGGAIGAISVTGPADAATRRQIASCVRDAANKVWVDLFR